MVDRAVTPDTLKFKGKTYRVTFSTYSSGSVRLDLISDELEGEAIEITLDSQVSVGFVCIKDLLVVDALVESGLVEVVKNYKFVFENGTQKPYPVCKISRVLEIYYAVQVKIPAGLWVSESDAWMDVRLADNSFQTQDLRFAERSFAAARVDNLEGDVRLVEVQIRWLK